MSKWRDFAPGLPLPATWTDGMEEVLSDVVGGNFKLSKASDAAVQVVAGPGDDQTGIFIDGKPRWATATKTGAVQGTPAAGDLDVYVTCHPDVFATDGEGHETNNTVSMEFAVVVGTPSGVGIQTHSRKVGYASWDGTKITRVVQTVGGGGAGGAAAQVYTALVGNGAATQFDVNHGLGTSNVFPVLRHSVTGEMVLPDYFVLSGDALRIVFDVAPGVNEWIVAVLAGSELVLSRVGSHIASGPAGAGAETWTVDHNLGTRDFAHVGIRRNVAPYDEVDAEIEFTSINQITVRTPGYAPVVNEFTVTLLAASGPVGAAAQHASQHSQSGSDPVIIPWVTSLPAIAGLADGYEVNFIADAANGIAWRLKYRAAEPGPYKWYCVGGADIMASGSTTSVAANHTTWTVPTGGAVQLAVPLAGDYMVEHGGATTGQAAGVTTFEVGLSVNGATPAVTVSHTQNTNAFQGVMSRAKNRITGLAAGATLGIRTRASQATNYDGHTFAVAARPVRVG